LGSTLLLSFILHILDLAIPMTEALAQVTQRTLFPKSVKIIALFGSPSGVVILFSYSISFARVLELSRLVMLISFTLVGI
jgi:hypothetical protein